MYPLANPPLPLCVARALSQVPVCRAPRSPQVSLSIQHPASHKLSSCHRPCFLLPCPATQKYRHPDYELTPNYKTCSSFVFLLYRLQHDRHRRRERVPQGRAKDAYSTSIKIVCFRRFPRISYLSLSLSLVPSIPRPPRSV